MPNDPEQPSERPAREPGAAAAGGARLSSEEHLRGDAGVEELIERYAGSPTDAYAEQEPVDPTARPTLDPALRVIQACQRILCVEGGACISMAVSWCVTEDDALDFMMPTEWVEAGRDSEFLLHIARQDAARLAR